jgi:hypothetical protein
VTVGCAEAPNLDNIARQRNREVHCKGPAVPKPGIGHPKLSFTLAKKPMLVDGPRPDCGAGVGWAGSATGKPLGAGRARAMLQQLAVQEPPR